MAKGTITPSAIAVNNIQTLPDVVVGQAGSLKTLFDKGDSDQQAYINTVLIPELNGNDGSKKIGHNSPNLGSDNVSDALEELQSNIVSVVSGSIPDNSITDIKLSNTAGQVKPRLATAESNISSLTTDVGTLETELDNFTTDFEYPVATVATRQIQIPKLGTNKVSRFKLSTAIASGTAITVSLDSGATSLPLRNISGSAILELEAGFYEVIADATFFTLRPSGGTKLTGDKTAVASSVSGTTLKLTPPKGCFDGVVGNNVVINDADFVATNIKSGVNLFGVVGSLVPLQVASGTKGTLTTTGNETVSGLSFTPDIVWIYTTNGVDSYTPYLGMILVSPNYRILSGTSTYTKGIFHTGSGGVITNGDTMNKINTDGFSFDKMVGNAALTNVIVRWVAVKLS